MKQLLRILRTVRHLQRRQIYWQLRNRLMRRWMPLPVEACAGSWQTVELPGMDSIARDRWQTLLPPVPIQASQQILSGTFCFLNDCRLLISAQKSDSEQLIDWRCTNAPLLWRYNLHYFDWLWSLDPQVSTQRDFIKHAVEQWWETSDSEAMKVGWAPYPTSLRLLNWTLLFFGRWYHNFREDQHFLKKLAWAIQAQQRELQKRLEFHLGANHLLENLVAVIVVDEITGSAAGFDRQRIDRLLAEQLQEQFLPDGCHYERSPMYHLRMLWLLDVLQRLTTFDPQLAEQVADCFRRAQVALGRMCHTDGQIALLNDAAFDIYNGEQLDPTLTKSGIWSLPDAGYYGARTDNGESLIIDAGPIGPDHQPGHAHADTFSFEWSLNGKRFITDTGVYDYEVTPFRLWTRATEAHNTVTLNQRSSSEVWSGFRVGRRAQVTLKRWEVGEQSLQLCAQHNGFFPQIHYREFLWSPGQLKISDQVTGKLEEAAHASGYLHFSPETDVHLGPNDQASREVMCVIGDRQVRIEITGSDDVTLHETWYCPRFGVKLPRTTLRYDFGNNSPTCTATLSSQVI